MGIYEETLKNLREDLNEYHLRGSGAYTSPRFARAAEHAASSLDITVSKKYIGEEATSQYSQTDRESSSWETFIESNEAMRVLCESRLVEQLPVNGAGDPEVASVFGRAHQILWDVMSGPGNSQAYLPGLEDLVIGLRHGPGGVAGVIPKKDIPGGHIMTSVVKTALIPLGFSDEKASNAYTMILSRGPQLMRAAAVKRDLAHGRFYTDAVYRPVDKNAQTCRGIVIQPDGNMQVQLSLGDQASLACKRLGLDLAVQQSLNRELAWWGSQNNVYDVVTGKLLHFCTLDAHDASNRIPRVIPEVMFHPRWALYINTFRSKRVKRRGPDGDCEVVEKWMMSGMGNGFTFPIMTLLFASIVIATYETLHLPLRGSPYTVDCVGSRRIRSGMINLWAVNGDDIIVVREAVPLLVKCLTLMGTVINEDKSYTTGDFRESCGGDYLDGVPVRGVYARKLDTVHQRISLVNRLNIWSSYYNVPLTRTVRSLLEQCISPGDESPLFVQTTDGFDEGVMVPPELFQYAPGVRSIDTRHGTIYRYKKWRPVVPQMEWVPLVRTKTMRAAWACRVDARSCGLSSSCDRGWVDVPVEVRRADEYLQHDANGKPWHWEAMFIHTVLGYVIDGRESFRLPPGVEPCYQRVSMCVPTKGRPWKYRSGHDRLWFEPAACHEAGLAVIAMNLGFVPR